VTQLTLSDAEYEWWSVRFGDVDHPREREELLRQSPLESVERMRAPLLVIQGANDQRVKKSESDQMVRALRALGRTPEYLVAEDEGHGFANEVNNRAAYAAVERFLARHLGGRFQEEMRAEVRRRLTAMTVDVDALYEVDPHEDQRQDVAW